jgi:hypothetical protein
MNSEDFFLKSGSGQLEKVYKWSRARYVAPWAVFFGVLLRVSASVPPTVQLPPVIGGRASLNLLAAFVGKSGTGKGNTTKVAALAWPNEILTLPLGSGQGIAEQLTKRGSSDIEPVIFDIPEIDTLTGLSSSHGSIVLPTLKSLAMGEQLGQANAAKETRRNVPAHSYRACVSIGAQPGHTDVLFNDSTGGTPQRFLWVAVTDPNISDAVFSVPEPLSTTMPHFTPGDDGVIEVKYADSEIEQSIIANHIARSRGDGDALDGHALLTRCKVAALLAIMHKRVEVTQWDWRMSAAVMAVSDETRRGLVQAAEDIRRQRELDRGAARALQTEGYEAGRMRSSKRAIVEQLTRYGRDGIARNELRSSLSAANRKVFDSAVQELRDEAAIEVVTVTRGERYRVHENCQGGSTRQGVLTQVNEGGKGCQGGDATNVISLADRRSHQPG